MGRTPQPVCASTVVVPVLADSMCVCRTGVLKHEHCMPGVWAWIPMHHILVTADRTLARSAMWCCKDSPLPLGLCLCPCMPRMPVCCWWTLIVCLAQAKPVSTTKPPQERLQINYVWCKQSSSAPI